MTAQTLAVHGGPPVRTAPWPRWPRATDATTALIEDVLRSTRWAVSGPYDGRASYERRFARAFADAHGVPYCTPVTSGTAALTVALQAVGVGPGDEVLVPGLTWVACASAVSHLGAHPVLVDCGPGELTMSPARARAAVTDRTAAIMVVHPFSVVADLDAFAQLSADVGIPLVEDCAQAHGARWRGRPVGTIGVAGCFSFQQAKLLTAGEGGATITADETLYDRMEQCRLDGRRFAADPVPGRLELVEIGTLPGRNLAMSEFHAAVLIEGLTRLGPENATRAEAAGQLETALAGCDGVDLIDADERVTTRAFYNPVLRLTPEAFAGASVDVIATALSAELGTAVNPVYTPLNRHRLLARLDLGRYPLPEADRIRRTCVTLTHPVLLDDKRGMEDIAEAVAKVRAGAAQLLELPQDSGPAAF